MDYQSLVVLAISGWVFTILFGILCGITHAKWQRAITGWMKALQDSQAMYKWGNYAYDLLDEIRLKEKRKCHELEPESGLTD